jgi:L-seryl-tRNA(Ser) seleniumtransferase
VDAKAIDARLPAVLSSSGNGNSNGNGTTHMTLHSRYGLSEVINAAGSFTPVGVSRSSSDVAQAAGEALTQFFVMDDLQDALSAAVCRFTGAEAGAAVHCVAAGITLSVAAAMTGLDPARIAALPTTDGMPNRVVLPAGHAVNYGHPIEQDIRLAGAKPILAGGSGGCPQDALRTALADPDTACLLLVSSRLVRGAPVDLTQAVAEAHRRCVPAIIDGAAQDMRIDELIATGADLVLCSAHKYLAAPTAGLVIGRRHLVEAVRAQQKGIGRGMKPSKEAIVGVLAAIAERQRLDLPSWRETQDRKVSDFVARASTLKGITARSEPDPAGMPFARACLRIDGERAGLDAKAIAQALKSGRPPIWVMEHRVVEGELGFELVQVTESEIATILQRLSALLGC